MSENESKPPSAGALACCCLGPQDGDPVCPCRMRERREREFELKAAQYQRLKALIDRRAATGDQDV